MTELDELLSAPLPSIADNGFSVRVTLRVEQEQFRKKITLQGIVIAGTLLLLLVALPFLGIDAAWQQAAQPLTHSDTAINIGVKAFNALLLQPQAWIAIGVVTLGIHLFRRFAED